MKPLLFLILLGSAAPGLAEPAAPAKPKKTATPPTPNKETNKSSAAPTKPGGTTMSVREFLIGTKWTWRNVSAGVPDRECIFMADGTFRHPHFVAKFTVQDPHVVVLTKKGGKAMLTFDADFKTFEAVDFDNRRITGSRL
ncbi:MAG: hypothetical protein U1F71_21795 [Verrucomicrobiaceae bacterium]